MGVLSHKVKKKDIKRGDHIYTWRALCTYSHHGIFVGENKVIHFTADGNWNLSSSSIPAGIPSSCPTFPGCGVRKQKSGVIVSCLDCFLDKGSLHLFEYGVSSIAMLGKRGGTCTTANSNPTETVIHRATYLLKHGYGNYDVYTNNCEDFALYCKTGLIDKRKVGSSGQSSSLVDGPVVALLCSALRLFIPTVVVAPLAAGMYFVTRYGGDIGVRMDLREVLVKDLAVHVKGMGPAMKGDESNVGGMGTTMESDESKVGDRGTTMEGDKPNIGDMGTTMEGDESNVGDRGETMEGDESNVGDMGTTMEGDESNVGDMGTTMEGDESNVGEG